MATRRRWPRDPQRERFWRGMLRQYRRSGTTVRDFCAAEKLRESAFYFWRREIERRDRERRTVAQARRPRRAGSAARSPVVGPRSAARAPHAAVQPSVFVPVQLTGAADSARPRLEVVLPSGATLHVPSGFDRATLASVLDVLEARGC